MAYRTRISSILTPIVSLSFTPQAAPPSGTETFSSFEQSLKMPVAMFTRLCSLSGRLCDRCVQNWQLPLLHRNTDLVKAKVSALAHEAERMNNKFVAQSP